MTALFIFLILENIIERYIPLVNYFDETIAIILAIYIIYKTLKRPVKKTSLDITVLLIFTILIGLLGNIVFNIQQSKLAIAKDILAMSKFFVTYNACAYFLPNKISNKDSIIILRFIKIYSIIIGIFAILDYIFELGMGGTYRGFIRTYQFLYSHATFYVSSLIIMISMLLIDDYKNNFKYILLDIVLLILSGRTKAYIYVAIFCIITLITKTNLRKNKINKKIIKRVFVLLLFVAAAAGYFIGKNKLMEYAGWGLLAARPALYIVSIEIARDYFPIGSGFGTFASTISGEYYSPLYYKYGIQNVSGLEKTLGYKYIADTFWPYIIGQLGVLGSIFYFMCFGTVIKSIITKYKKHLNRLIVSLITVAYIIEACFVEAFITNSTCILYAMCLGYYFYYFEYNKNLNDARASTIRVQ